jgi:CTP-dependent riboflavin kinase
MARDEWVTVHGEPVRVGAIVDMTEKYERLGYDEYEACRMAIYEAGGDGGG